MPPQSMTSCVIAQASRIAPIKSRRYAPSVAANSVTGFGDPIYLAHRRPIRQQALFLCLPFRVMAAVCGRPSGLPGSKFPVRQPAHSCHPKSFGDDQWQLQLTWSTTHARPQSVQNPRRRPPGNGSRRSTRKLKPCYPPRTLQPTYEHCSLPGNRRGCAMRSASKGLEGRLPEDLLSVCATNAAGVPIDAITAACSRVDAVLHLLMAQFNSGPDVERLSDSVIANVIWDVQGTVGLIRSLALHGDRTTYQLVHGGGE